MRVIAVGATGTAGAMVLQELAADERVDEVVSLVATGTVPSASSSAEAGIERREVDLTGDLSDHLRFADAVVFAGWVLTGREDVVMSPEPVLAALHTVCSSMISAGVHTFVYCSPVGANSPAFEGPSVAERQPKLTKFSHRLSLQVSRCERLVDQFERDNAIVRVVRLRPGLLVYDRGAMRRGSWLGKKIGETLIGGKRTRLVPNLDPHEIQVVHVSDLAHAICLAITESVLGDFDVAAGPIDSELLARVFAAKRVTITPRQVTTILSLGRHFGFSSMDPAWFELALRSPLLDQTRAREELGWGCEHSETAVLEAWAETLPFRRDRVIPDAPHVDHVRGVDHQALYRESLAYFGQRVRAIPEDGWKDLTQYRDWNVWQIVAFVARQQYRLDLIRKGRVEATEIDALLPGDPLGIAPADGWDLAAERGDLAVVAMSDLNVHGGKSGDTHPGFDQLLSDAICEIVLLGWYLGETIGAGDDIEPELSRFVHECLEVFA